QAGRGGLAINQHVLFGKVPATRSNDQCRRLLIQSISLALGAGEAKRASVGFKQIELAFERAFPGWRMGVLEVGHVTLGAAIERINYHLLIDWPGDFDPAATKIRRNRRYFPFAGSDRLGLGGECWHFSAIQSLLRIDAPAQEL